MCLWRWFTGVQTCAQHATPSTGIPCRLWDLVRVVQGKDCSKDDVIKAFVQNAKALNDQLTNLVKFSKGANVGLLKTACTGGNEQLAIAALNDPTIALFPRATFLYLTINKMGVLRNGCQAVLQGIQGGPQQQTALSAALEPCVRQVNYNCRITPPRRAQARQNFKQEVLSSSA